MFKRGLRIKGSIYLFVVVVIVVVGAVVVATGITLIRMVVDAEFFSAVSLSIAYSLNKRNIKQTEIEVHRILMNSVRALSVATNSKHSCIGMPCINKC